MEWKLVESMVKKKKRISPQWLIALLDTSDNLMFHTARFMEAVQDFKMKGCYTDKVMELHTDREIAIIKRRLDPGGELDMEV